MPNLDKQVVFYDPHPGIGGPIVKLPVPLKNLADALDGQTKTLNEAVGEIKQCLTSIPDSAIWVERGYIAVRISQGVSKHSWRLISFRYPHPRKNKKEAEYIS